MEIRFRDTSVDAVKTDLLVLPVQEKKLEEPPLRALDRRLKGRLRQRMQKANFTGGEGSTLLYSTAGMSPAAYLLLIGAGNPKEIESDTWRKLAARARREATTIGAEDMTLFFAPEKEPDAAASAIVEGLSLASYQFDKYRSNSKPAPELKSLTLFKPGLNRSAAIEKSIQTAQATIPGVFLARDLINEPPSVTTARFLGTQAQRHCRGRGLSVEVWGKKKIESMKLAGLLAVNRGSHEEPRFIKIHYKPSAKPKKKVALIGKGITFDSGGLSLKPAKSMETMKLDMAGGAAVIGAMSRLPYLNFDIEVTGYVPTTDNLPGGNAQKPGDVIRYLNGKTIEVLNTDAEGRLILADALALASREKPDAIVDLATLTGACRVALGTGLAGVMGNDERLVAQLIEAGRAAGEPLWQLPLVREYREDLKSPIADLKNVGGEAGTITAGPLLREGGGRRAGGAPGPPRPAPPGA